MPITSLPFVHTARRSYRLSDSVSNSEIDLFSFAEHVFRSSLNLITWARRSCNKVFAGEPGADYYDSWQGVMGRAPGGPKVSTLWPALLWAQVVAVSPFHVL